MEEMSRHLPRWVRSPALPLAALVIGLGAGGYVLTSTTIRDDRDEAAQRRAQVEAVHTQEVLGRARSYVAGLAEVLAREPEPHQATFARWASATSASVGLTDVFWVERVLAAERRAYERRRGVPITRLTPSGRIVRAPPARAYLPATFTSRARPELRPGLDVSTFPALGAAIADRRRIFAVGASRPGALGTEPGFYLLEAASFARGPGSRGYLVAFVPRGWFTTTLGGDPRRIAISAGGERLEGQLDDVSASATFEMLGRTWRIDVGREPPSGLQSMLPWLALAWPFAVVAIALPIARAVALRRRAQRQTERIFELSLDLLAIIGPDGRYRGANPAFERTLGYPRGALIGRTFESILHPDDLPAARDAFGQLAGGEAINEFECRMLRADGFARWIQWSGRAVAEEGVIYGIGRDVTERRRVDAELRAARRTAEARGAELQVRAAEQAALRRVATVVAEESSQAQVFRAVAEEIGGLLGTEVIRMLRYEGDRAIVVASAGTDEPFPFGSEQRLDGDGIAAQVFHTRRTARVDDDPAAGRAPPEGTRSIGMRSAVAAPILVEGRVWGAIVTGSPHAGALPPETEARLGAFTELMATAIANAESRAALRQLADEQAALRRVTTRVVEGAAPAEVFAAVAVEVAAVLGADHVVVGRYEAGDELTVLAHGRAGGARADGAAARPGARINHAGETVEELVRRRRRSARIAAGDDGRAVVAELPAETGVRVAVAAPILVERQLWGVISAGWTADEAPAADTEQRLAQFAGLLETAIAHADSREQLTASRARLVTEADEARRRVVRDLHDGAQQRLIHAIVTLKLARQALGGDGGTAAALVDEALQQAQRGNEELRELAHGILPTVLTRGGLPAGVESVVSRLDLPVTVDVPDERLPTEIEASAYFLVAEALTNVVKHAHARSAEVRVRIDDGTLRVAIRDDGIGGADPRGAGLVGMNDRVTALGGRLEVESPPGGGTCVTAVLPIPRD